MDETGGKSSRRAFLKAGAVGALAVGAVSAQNIAATGAQTPRPNFIFITTDGHRPDALSLNGNSVLRTPNIDRIGREGVQFENSFVVNALCLPSRASALTGLYSHTTGCIEPPEEFELYDLREDPGELHNLYGDSRYATLARDLRQRIRELRKETGDHDTGAKL